MSQNVEFLMYISSIILFVLGIFCELVGYNTLSCWLIAIMLVFVFIILFPKLVRRFKKKQTKFTNFLNFCAILFFSFIVVYLMASLLYYGIWGRKFWDSYEIVLYPAILIYLLIESYLSFILKGKYKLHGE